MKSKKKTTNNNQKPLSGNKIRTIKIKDGKQYKILESLLAKYSLLIKGFIQENADQDLVFPDIDSQSFDYIYEFLQLHKDKQPQKIKYPLKSNQHLKYVMEQMDAQLIQRIMSKGDVIMKKVLNAACYFQIQDFKKRVISGIAMKLIGSTVQQLKQEYDINKQDLNQDELKMEIKNQIEILSKLEDD